MENKYNYVPLSEVVKAANLKNEISLSAYHNSMVDLWDMFGRPNPEPIITEDIDHEVVQPKQISE